MPFTTEAWDTQGEAYTPPGLYNRYTSSANRSRGYWNTIQSYSQPEDDPYASYPVRRYESYSDTRNWMRQPGTSQIRRRYRARANWGRALRAARRQRAINTATQLRAWSVGQNEAGQPNYLDRGMLNNIGRYYNHRR